MVDEGAVDYYQYNEHHTKTLTLRGIKSVLTTERSSIFPRHDDDHGLSGGADR